MREHDWFAGYPEQKRVVGPSLRTIHNRIAASERGREFYDGDRANGYGGMVNDGRWEPIANGIVAQFGAYRRVLQVGAHKGFLLYELFKLGARTYGCETSEYATNNSMTRLDKVSNWYELPYETAGFDLVIATSVVYTLNLGDAIKCLKEIERVKSPTGKSFITLAAYEDENDIEGLMLLRYWFLLGTTILTKEEWIEVMKHAGYTGDYRFDTAKYLNLVRA